MINEIEWRVLRRLVTQRWLKTLRCVWQPCISWQNNTLACLSRWLTAHSGLSHVINMDGVIYRTRSRSDTLLLKNCFRTLVDPTLWQKRLQYIFFISRPLQNFKTRGSSYFFALFESEDSSETLLFMVWRKHTVTVEALITDWRSGLSPADLSQLPVKTVGRVEGGWTEPPRRTEVSLTTGDTLRRSFTAALTRTATPGRRRQEAFRGRGARGAGENSASAVCKNGLQR